MSPSVSLPPRGSSKRAGEIVRGLYNASLSLRTAVTLLLVTVACLAVGAVVMPNRPATYSGINDELLFRWLLRAGTGPDNVWFWGALGSLGLLALQTILCSVDALRKLVRGDQAGLKISPHLMHLGFLLILLGHLLSAGWGFRYGGTLPQGFSGALPDGSTLVLKSVDMSMDSGGFPRDWWADVSLLKSGRLVAQGRLGANKPLFHDGMGIYLKSLTMTRVGPGAELVTNKDPGAPWVLGGALIFTAGNMLLLVLKARRESPV